MDIGDQQSAVFRAENLAKLDLDIFFRGYDIAH